jgi:uncharacterized BrkB/YihY/UPF0761 family membrane protein
MPGKIPVLDGRKPAQVGGGLISLGIKILTTLVFLGIAFIVVSCAAFDSVVNNLFPSKQNEYTIFELWTFIFPGIFSYCFFSLLGCTNMTRKIDGRTDLPII